MKENFKTLHWSTATAIGLLLYCILWFLLKDKFQYLIDADAVGYMTVAEHYAKKEFTDALNGYWSPMHSWLASILYQPNRFEFFQNCMKLNFGIGAIVIFQTFFYLRKYAIPRVLGSIVSLTLPIAIVYYVFYQEFADVLVVVFLLLYLERIRNGNFQKAIHLVIIGIIIALAGFAKAYCFYFLLFHFLCILVLHYKEKIAARFLIVAISSFLLVLPFSYALYQKYNSPNILGYSGKLNFGWYLHGTKPYHNGITQLIPPHQSDACAWVDPFIVHGEFSGFFDGFRPTYRFFARAVYNCIITIKDYSTLQLLILPLLVFIFYVYKNKIKKLHLKNLFLFSILLPIGYIFIHVEQRFFIVMVPVSIFLAVELNDVFTHKKTKQYLSILFGIGLILYPIYHGKQLLLKGEKNYQLSETLRNAGIQNKKIICNAANQDDYFVACYLSYNQLYIRNDHFTEEFQSLKQEINKFSIDYYIENNEYENWKELEKEPSLQLITTENLAKENKIFKIQLPLR
jgi:hypothetical protein